MARYTGPKEKIERRLGSRAFLKGERSLSPKSAAVKRPYPPGQHGKSFQRKLSEFGTQLKSKQKIRNVYRMLEKQFKNTVKEAMKSKQETGELLVRMLESRLDNVVFRAGLAQSRDQARQVVNHGHILVNGRKNSIPSYQVRKSDQLSIRAGSQRNSYFGARVQQWLKNYDVPAWLDVNKNDLSVKLKAVPTFVDSGLDFSDIQSIIEYYSR